MPTRLRLTAFVFTAMLACSMLVLPAPALAVSDDPVLKRMDAVLEENTRLRDNAWKAHKSNDPKAASQAAEALAASEELLERTRTEALAHVAGISTAQVEALRKDGKSWGQVSGELGVHPGFLGVGKTPLYEARPASKAKAAKAVAKKGKSGSDKKAGAKKPAPKDKATKDKAVKAKATKTKEKKTAKDKAQAKSKNKKGSAKKTK